MLLERKRRQAEQGVDASQTLIEIRCRLVATFDQRKPVELGPCIGLPSRANLAITLMFARDTFAAAVVQAACERRWA